MKPCTAKLLNLSLCLAVALALGCSEVPAKPDDTPVALQSAAVAHTRKLLTPAYSGGGAVIFVLDRITIRDVNAANQVIRVFGENDASLDVAVRPPQEGGLLDTDTLEPVAYSDAGIIDVSIDGNSVAWLKFNSPASGTEYDRLVADLVGARNQVRQTFGTFPYACVVPPEAITEANYNAIQASGLKVLCSVNSDNLHPSNRPTSWSGNIEAGGLYRLPIIGIFSSEGGPDQNAKLLAGIKDGISSLGVAVIELDMTLLAKGKGPVDPSTIAQLSELIKASSQLGAITTLENWYSHISDCPQDATGIKRPLPPYNGGPVIIFRLDDVSKGNREEVVQAIIKMFQANGVPVDCGVVSNANGTDSYKIPWLKQYVDQNAVGISVHGYDWTFYQMDITKRYLGQINDTACININTVKAEAEKAKLSYEELKFKLLQARCQYLKYYGIIPVAFTVPTDFYDELGYRAVQDAGYKVFAVHKSVEPCPSTVPVDYFCHVDLDTGMYRLPTSYDLCEWYACAWGKIYNLDKPMAQKDYCIYVDAYGESQEYNDFAISVCTDMNSMDVAVMGLHPDCFADKDGNPDTVKLEKADKIIKWFKSFATIMTFEQWYRYRTSKP